MHGPERMKTILLTGLLAAGLLGCAGQQQAGPAPATETARSEAPKHVAAVPEAAETGAIPSAEVQTPQPPATKVTKAPKATSAECYQLRAAGGKKGGRCEPQSLPYARCRSGIMSCRTGKENGPLTWFACEQKRGNTGSEPRAGSILVLTANKGHGMPTGHIMYVEAVSPLTPTTYELILSHTNYDRKCSLESKIKAVYDRPAMSLDLKTGAWKAWGHGLKLAGFILD